MSLHGYTTPHTTLIRKDGSVVHPGDTLEWRHVRGEVMGWRAGSHPGSSGRVLIRDKWGPHEYFPHVFDCEVIHD